MNSIKSLTKHKGLISTFDTWNDLNIYNRWANLDCSKNHYLGGVIYPAINL